MLLHQKRCLPHTHKATFVNSIMPIHVSRTLMMRLVMTFSSGRYYSCRFRFSVKGCAAWPDRHRLPSADGVTLATGSITGMHEQKLRAIRLV